MALTWLFWGALIKCYQFYICISVWHLFSVCVYVRALLPWDKNQEFEVRFGRFSSRSATHRGHLVGDEVAVLCQHVRHHKCGELWVGVRVDQPIVWQRVAEVACRVMVHQVKRGRFWVIGWSDGGDFIVFISGSVSTGRATASSPAVASLACVVLGEKPRGENMRKHKTVITDFCKRLYHQIK